MGKESRCVAERTQGRGRCVRPGRVHHRGRWYCWQHAPERGARSREAQERRLALETAAGLRPAQVGMLTDGELESIAAAGGVLAFVREPGRLPAGDGDDTMAGAGVDDGPLGVSLPDAGLRPGGPGRPDAIDLLMHQLHKEISHEADPGPVP